MEKTKYVKLPPDRDKKFLGVFTRRRSFYRTLLPLLVIITLQQLASLIVNMADNVMLGRYTELSLSGSTLVNQLQFTLQQIVSAIGMGIVVMASQYWGQGKTQPIKKIITLGTWSGFLGGMLFLAVSLAVPEGVLSLFTDDTAVISEGVKYLKIICWTYPVFGFSNALMYSLRSVETAAVGTVMSVSTILINVCLNYCLIFGNLGAPELGIEGAAIATLISRIAELLIILVYVLRMDKKLKMKIKDLFTFDFSYLNGYIRVAMPMILSGTLWGVAQAVQTAILGHMSSGAIAANSIASIVFQIFAVVGMSCGNAASVIIGKTIGEDRLDLIRSYSKTMQAIFLLLGIVSGILLFLFKGMIVDFYTVSGETKALTVEFLTVLSVAIVGSCYEYPVEGGIIAGGGVTKYAAIVDNLFMWLFTIPAAYLSAFVFGFPPLVTFCFLKADQILKCIPNAIYCNRFRWVRRLTKKRSEESL